MIHLPLILIVVLESFAIGLTLPNQECVVDPHRSRWTDLKRVAVMPKDGRYGITKGAAKVGLSSEEVEWIRSVTGSVICRDPQTKVLNGGTGTVFGRNDQILTSAHVVLKNKKIRPECYFMTRTDPPVLRALLLSSKQTVFGTKDTEAAPTKDMVLVRLDKPLDGAKAVKILPDLASLNQKQSVILVSARQWRLTNEVGDNEPIV